MDQIESIRRGRGQLYRLGLASGDSLSVSEDVLVKYRLLKGMEVSPELLAEVKEASQLDYGYQQALNYLSYQLRSEKEIRDHLAKKEVSPASINQILVKLRELDLVDDQVYGDSYVRTQMRLSDKGPRVIAQQLRQRGLKPAVIEQALTHYPIEQQLAVGLEVAQKALHRDRRRSHYEKMQRLRQHLMRKGFESERIEEIFAELAVEKDPAVELAALESEGEKLWRRNQRFTASERRQKVKNGLYRRGFSFAKIDQFLDGKEDND